MNKPLVSVVVPCYNVEKYLMRCLKSIVNQSYGIENLEIILVDDASLDSSGDIIDAFKNKYCNNVLVVHFSMNKGVSVCRNVGIDMASGKYICFVDSDDYIHPDMIAHMVDKAEELGCDYIQCKYRDTDGYSSLEEATNGGCDRFVNLGDVAEKKNAIISTYNFYVWNKLYLRKFLIENDIRFPEGRYYEDQPFTLMCMVIANSCYYLDEVLYYYFINPQSIVRSGYSLNKERDLVYSADFFFEEMKKKQEHAWLLDELKYELEAFFLFKVYFVANYFLNKELEWYKARLIERYPDILNSPYVTNICDPATLKVVDTLR